MKIKLQIIFLMVIFLLSSYLIYTFVTPKTDNYTVTEDELKFKNEYELLNNKTNDSGKEYMSVSIVDNNNVSYKNAQEIIEILKTGTGIIYFGFPECPWCRNLVPVLVNTVKNNGVGPIYYFNAYDIRDKKSLDENGNIVVEKEGTKEYNEIVDLLKNYLGSYQGLNDENIKRLYFPTVVFVKEGTIVDVHIGTVDTQEDPYVELTTDEKNILINELELSINEVFDIVCDESC